MKVINRCFFIVIFMPPKPPLSPMPQLQEVIEELSLHAVAEIPAEPEHAIVR